MKGLPVKIFCLVVWLVLADHGKLCAQTDTNAVKVGGTNAPVEVSVPAPTNIAVVLTPRPRPKTLISADRGEFDMAGRVVTYRGHVRVDDPEMKLTSEWLITDLPQSGEHVNHIVAETNVVIDFRDEKGRPVHATGDKAVYSYEMKNGTTNELVALSGNAKVENPEFIMTGEPIILNLATRKITANNPVVTSRQTFIKASPGTNSPPVTRPPPDMTNSPLATPRAGADTNFSPGKLDLVPEPRVAPHNY